MLGSTRWVVLVLWGVLIAVAGCGKDDSRPRATADAGPTGASPEVVACGRGEACPQGRTCDPFRGCVECLFDEQCGPAQRCTDRVCEAATVCSETARCSGTDKVCDVGSGRCVECLLDTDCPRGNHCEGRECKPFEACINSFDCKGGKVCGLGGECVQCATQGDCALGEVCIQGSCARSCDGDTDCLALKQLCDTRAKHCVACVSDRDCPDTHHCAAGKCAIDVCVQETVRCTGTASFVACAPNGSQSQVASCPSMSVCSGKDMNQPCVSQICVPGAVACDETGTKQRTCAADGLSFVSTTSCATGERCVDGKCVNTSCPPGELYCDGVLRARCNAQGTGPANYEPCATGNVCSSQTAECVAAACTVGGKICQDGVPAECKDGLTYEKGAACEDGSGCVNGACVPVVCTPSKTRCDGAIVMRCNTDGSAEQVYDNCNSNAVCVEENGTAFCKAKTCTPGALTCEADKLKTCNSLGTGLEGEGTDCAATSQACYAGACKNVVCTGTRICIGGQVHDCKNRGTETALYSTCTLPNVCRPNSGSAYCGSPLCTPNAKSCSGNAVATCNADGSDYLPNPAPCAANTACLNGTCLPVVCTTPSGTYCSQGNVYTCGPQGVSTTLSSTCTAAQFCYQQGTYAYCLADVCTAGAPACRESFATTCAADGSGPLPTGGTNCAATAGRTCDTGTCKAVVCDKNEYYCKSGSVELCNATGTASTLYQTCDATMYCKEEGTSAGCFADICTPSAPVCDGEKPATCDATGGVFVPGATNCATSGQVCNQSAACSATAVDPIGNEPSVSLAAVSAGAYLSQIQVRTARDLVQIEQFLAINGTAVLTWVVYEVSGGYTRVFEKTASVSGNGTGVFVSSGAIDVALAAGKTYAIGVLVGSSHSIKVDATATERLVSFGRTTYGLRFSGTTAPATGGSFFSSSPPVQKLTTKLP